MQDLIHRERTHLEKLPMSLQRFDENWPKWEKALSTDLIGSILYQHQCPSNLAP